jgi:hypothetical protein
MTTHRRPLTIDEEAARDVRRLIIIGVSAAVFVVSFCSYMMYLGRDRSGGGPPSRPMPSNGYTERFDADRQDASPQVRYDLFDVRDESSSVGRLVCEFSVPASASSADILEIAKHEFHSRGGRWAAISCLFRTSSNGAITDPVVAVDYAPNGDWGSASSAGQDPDYSSGYSILYRELNSR